MTVGVGEYDRPLGPHYGTDIVKAATTTTSVLGSDLHWSAV